MEFMGRRLSYVKIVPVREGSEEYLDSEKYQVRVWDMNNPNSLKDLIRT